MNIRYLALKILIIVSCLHSYAQNTQNDSIIYDLLNDESFEVSVKKNTFHFLYARTNFDNSTFYAGREIGVNQYNISQQISYFSTKGFSFGVSGAWYSKSVPRYGTTVLNAGYGRSFGKTRQFRLSTSYNHYLYNPQSEYEAGYHSGVYTSFSFRQKYFGSRVNLNIFLGQEIGKSAGYSLYGRFKLLEFGKYSKLEFEPEFNLFFSEESVLNENISFLDGSDSELVYDYTYNDKFGLMNAQLKLPLTLSAGNFDFETGVNINRPRSLDPSVSYNNTASWYLSVGYLFNLQNF